MEVEFSIFQPSFYDKCEMPAMSSSDLCGDWKNFEFLPTPPRSPERDMGLVPEEGQLFEGVADICCSENHSSEIPVDDLFDPDNTAFDDVFGRLTADEKAFSDSIDEALNIIKDGEAAVDDLLQDFMWSTPGFDPFGFGPRSYDADPLVGGVPASASASAVPAPAFIVIDPAHAFDGSGNHDNGSDDDEDTADVTGDEEEEKPALGQGQDENTDDEVTGDDDDEEIDVVSVHRVKKEVQMTSNLSVVRHHVSHAPSHVPASTSSRQSLLAINRPRPTSNNQHVVKREYTDDVSPDDVASITSHVAAMHNYFSTSSASPYSHSAPQSPTPGYERRDAYKRVRSWESYPPSPASLLAKKPRPSTTVGDLRSAAGALSRFKSQAGSGCYYGNGRRGSSGLSSRCPVNKQRELHNVLERKRRDDLRGNFVNLRNILPSMSSSRDRMPKVVILRKSREYIRALKVSFQKLSEELANQEARNKHLRQRLAELRNDNQELC